ncbi:hypothetical protein PS1_023161 [Malus domestica]
MYRSFRFEVSYASKMEEVKLATLYQLHRLVDASLQLLLLQLSPNLLDLIPQRIHHPGVEDCFEYVNLLRLWVPSGFWLRTAFFKSMCY